MTINFWFMFLGKFHEKSLWVWLVNKFLLSVPIKWVEIWANFDVEVMKSSRKISWFSFQDWCHGTPEVSAKLASTLLGLNQRLENHRFGNTIEGFQISNLYNQSLSWRETDPIVIHLQKIFMSGVFLTYFCC